MFLIIPLLLSLTQQLEPVRIDCTVQDDKALACAYTNSEYRDFKLPFSMWRRFKWQQYMDDTQQRVTTLQLEDYGDRLCLVKVEIQDSCVTQTPVNERINACVSTKQTAKGKRKGK